MKNTSCLLVCALLAGCGGAEFEAPATQADAGSQDSSASDASHDTAPNDGSKPDAPPDSGPKPDSGKDAQVIEASVVDVVTPDAQVTCSGQKDREFAVVADGMIPKDACGANTYNSFPHANVGIGRGLLRFTLDAVVATALKTPGKVLGMSLVLQRNVTCENDANCPAEDGQLQAYPLASDWIEGDGSSYSGADWCRKSAGGQGQILWHVPGADGDLDRGALAGTLKVTAVQDSASIPLDPEPFAKWVTDNGNVSILLVAELSATFVFATRESTLYSPPRLIIKYCE